MSSASSNGASCTERARGADPRTSRNVTRRASSPSISKIKPRRVALQVGRQALGPLHRRHPVAVQVFLERLQQLGLDAFQSIQVDVVQPESAAVLRLDHERRAAHRGVDVQAARQALNERRLAGAERPFEQEPIARHGCPAERRAELAHVLRANAPAGCDSSRSWRRIRLTRWLGLVDGAISGRRGHLLMRVVGDDLGEDDRVRHQDVHVVRCPQQWSCARRCSRPCPADL